MDTKDSSDLVRDSKQIEARPELTLTVEEFEELIGNSERTATGTDRFWFRLEFGRVRTGREGSRRWPRYLSRVLASAAGSASVAAGIELAGYTDYIPFF